MEKIASPKELAAELQRILAYTETAEPSREKIAADLKALANRVAFPARRTKGPSFGQEGWEPKYDTSLRRKYQRAMRGVDAYLEKAHELAIEMGFPPDEKEGQDMNPAGALWEAMGKAHRTYKCNIYWMID